MTTPNYFAPLLALAAHIDGQQCAPQESTKNLPEYKTQRACVVATQADVSSYLVSMNSAAIMLAAADDMPAATLVRLAAHSVEQGLRGLLVGLGHPADTALPTVLKEIGRLVVRNAFPRPSSCYATGAVGDFSVHRLPLAGYKTGLHIATQEIETEAALSEALFQARTEHAKQVRQFVQNSPSIAIRSTATGKPLTKFTDAHWLQLTWRLGTTSVFTLLLTAGQRAATDTSLASAPTGLHAALLTIVRYCQQVFTAYLAPELAYTLVGEASFVAPAQLAA